MRPNLRLLLRIAGGIVFAVGSGYLLKDIWQSFSYEGAAPAHPIGPPALHLSASQAYAVGFHISGVALAMLVCGAILLAVSFRRERTQ